MSVDKLFDSKRDIKWQFFKNWFTQVLKLILKYLADRTLVYYKACSEKV